jgi:ATP:ADP antiporter, AAA family
VKDDRVSNPPHRALKTRWNAWTWVARTRFLDRTLSLITRPVYPGEGISSFLLGTNLFLLLSSYYLLKTVRDALILSGSGPEVRAYSTAAQAMLLLFTVPLYGWLAARFNRTRLILVVTLFFLANLLGFAVLGRAGVPIDVPFFLWLGIFNVVVVAQFWAFASDVYTESEGRRLFPVVGVGSSLGALLGAGFSGPLFVQLGPTTVMLMAAVLLAGAMGTTWVVNRYICTTCGGQPLIADELLKGRDGFQLVFADRYLFLIAALVLVLNFVNTGGEFLLAKMAVAEADARAAFAADVTMTRQAYISEFYGRYHTLVNALGLLVQVALVSRVFRWVGVRGALFIAPVIALGGYSFVALAPLLGVLGTTKLFENAANYSLQATAQHTLFLSVSRDAKYKAMQAVDTFFWRAGDLALAALVVLGSALAFSVRQYALILTLSALGWLVVVALLAREHRRREARRAEALSSGALASQAS